MPVVYVQYTDNEYADLIHKAKEEGLPLSLYIRKVTLGDSEFVLCYKELLKRIDTKSIGTHFSLRDIFNTDWMKISKGVRLALGRQFFKEVDEGNVSRVISDGADSAKVQWYKIVENNDKSEEKC